MSVIEEAKAKIKDRGLKLVMPEGDDDRILTAAEILARDRLAVPIIFGAGQVPIATEAAIASVISKRPKLSNAMATKLLMKPLFAAGAMVACGQADAMLAGVAHPTARVIEAALMTVGLAPGLDTPSSFFLMRWPDKKLVFADCAVNIQPRAEQLADIAIASAVSARRIFAREPRVALLSFSTKGSGDHADVAKVTRALAIVRAKFPDILIDGELQGDTALSASVAARKLNYPGDVAGRADVLIFPDLGAGNIAYKLVQQLAGAEAIGPILHGFAAPVSDLSRGANVREIVDTACLLLAQCVETSVN